EAMNRAFEQFVENIPFYGFAVLCLDHPVVQAMIARIDDRRVVTYGHRTHADVRALDIAIDPSGARYDVVISARGAGSERLIRGPRLPIMGRPHLLNPPPPTVS